METLKWTGKKGNEIELMAYCQTKMTTKRVDLDGDIIDDGIEEFEDAELELWVDGEKMDSSHDTNFWRIIDVPGHPGYKKVWGLKLMMDQERAEIVDRFLKSVIENGKTAEVEEHEEAEAAKALAEEVEQAEEIVVAAEHTVKNNDGSLIMESQARTWEKQYNDLHNEGGEGYIPRVVTQESYDRAMAVLEKTR